MTTPATALESLSKSLKNLLNAAADELSLIETGQYTGMPCERLDSLKDVLKDLMEAAQRFHAMYDNAAQGMFMATLDGYVFEANPALARMLGYETPDQMLPVEDFAREHYVNPPDRQRIVDVLLEGGVARNLEVNLKRLDGTPIWCLLNVRLLREPGPEPLIEGITVDITPRKLAEQALKSSEERHRRILETTGEAVAFLDQKMVIREVNEAFYKLLGLGPEQVLGRRILDFADEDFREFLSRNFDRFLSMDQRTYEGVLVDSQGHNVPVLVHANTLRGADGRAMGNVAFLTDMTESKKAVALAAQVQESLLPDSSPTVPGLDVAGRSLPSQETGGDYFDWLEVSFGAPGAFRAVVGDVAGHGLDAALLMTMARGFLRMRAAQPGSLADIVGDLNFHLTKDTLGTGRFMTLMLVEIQQDCQEIHWVRAGHDPALLYDPSRDRFRELLGRGVALGVVPEAGYQVRKVKGLAPGQVLVVGTDGIWEAQDREGEMFGKQRLKNIIKAKAGLSSLGILDEVFKALWDFSGRRLRDDATLVVIKAGAAPPM